MIMRSTGEAIFDAHLHFMRKMWDEHANFFPGGTRFGIHIISQMENKHIVYAAEE